MEKVMVKRFEGKTALITGAAQGIGFGIAKHLALEGARVLLNDIDPSLLTPAVAEIQNLGAVCVAVAGDSSDPAVIQEMIDTAVKEFKQLDLVVANAGITLFGDFFDYPSADLHQVLKVNVAGTFLLLQAAARQLRSQGLGGSFLITSSVTGHQAHKNLAAYGMSKAALEMLAKSLVLDLSPYKITINTVVPGATATERTLLDKDYETIWSQLTPMGRAAGVEDIAQTALFLLSDAARHITGQSLVVDGGWTVTSPSPE
ncbi:SDR family NAD(P)-dependent oxidoreductase [Sphingobacterium sp. Mn56C]|uniref:SDR family NAD(P)-dependent oxidoreductase n=1 Tax=Sphingobacterium sp. Mn56C TaxID=3395261 RepID=UPI003BE71C40